MLTKEWWPLTSAILAKGKILIYNVVTDWFLFYYYSYGVIGLKWQGYGKPYVPVVAFIK